MSNSKIKLLDDILSYLGIDTTWRTLRKTFPDTDVPLDHLKSILRKLESDGYINRFDGKVLLTGERGYLNETKIIRNTEGDLFVEQGGYKKRLGREKASRNLKHLKTAFEVVIALATILLSIMSYRQANKISTLENKNDSLKARIELINTKIAK
ncbi:MAG TPA: hypothetical protein VIJ75_08100 [Hanamia sp.]